MQKTYEEQKCNNFRACLKKYKIQVAITLLLVLIWTLFASFAPDVFLAKYIYFSYASSIPIIIILSLGLLPLIIAGEFDMSFPSTLAISGFIFAYTHKISNSLLLSVILCLLSGILVGFMNAILVLKIKVPSIIATIGTQFLYRGLATVLSGGLSLSLVNADGFLKSLFVGRIYDVFPAQAIIAIFFCIIYYFFIFKHPLGDNILFTGDDINSAKMLGINVEKTKMLLFVNMGFMSSLASIILCLEFINWWPSQGDGYMLLIFAAIFLGGTSVYGGEGSVYGTLIGSIIIGIMESGIIAMGLDAFWTRFIYGLIIILAVSFYAKFLNTSKIKIT